VPTSPRASADAERDLACRHLVGDGNSGGPFADRIYYAPNTWNFTKRGHIGGLTQADLLAVLGDGGVTVTLSAGPFGTT
jgi:hypothetical protein